MKETVVITSNAYFPNVGGVENSLRYLADSYLKLGYKVIIVISDVSPNQTDLPYKEVSNNTIIYRYPTFPKTQGVKKYLRPFYSAYSALKLLKSLKKTNKIVLTLSRFHTSTLIAKLAKLPNIVYLVPGVVKNQNTSENLVKGKPSIWFKLNLSLTIHHLIQKYALKYSDRVVVFSKNMAEQISEISSISNLPILKPGVDNIRFHPEHNKVPLRDRFSIPANKIVLLTVGRFVRAKGFDLVIDAMTKLPECHLVMVGDGENMDETRRQIKDKNLDTQITLMGSQNDVSSFYQLADIFLMSSRYEPLGQTILEGLSSGLPIVAFKGSGVTTATTELLEENEAVYTESLSSQGLVKCINKLLVNPNLMADMGLKGRNIAVTRFSWMTLAQQILELKSNEFEYP